jgi:signal transduction histidine kinase
VRRFSPRSFRAKIVLSTVALVTAVMLLVGLGIQLLLGHTAERDINQVLQERAEAMVGVIGQSSSGRLTVPPAALEPGVEVFDSDGNLVAGSVETVARSTAAQLGTTRSAHTVSGPGDQQRLLGVPFATQSGDRGVIVVSQATAPYERSELYALVATGALGALVIAVAALIALRVTRQALQPVTQMAIRASEWSERDLTHRFDLGTPTDELSALGETLDHLLDRVASAILSEQRLTSELAHELRTPLTVIQGSADLALLRGVEDADTRRDLEQVSASAHEMSQVIATLLDLAREGATGIDQQTCHLADVVPALLAAVPPGTEVEDATAPSTARIAAPGHLVVRAVLPLVDNAVRHAASALTLTATDHHDKVELVVTDDGPGVTPGLRETLFEPGVTQGAGGAGLGLGIARRVARSFGGEIVLARGREAAFVVTLPRH